MTTPYKTRVFLLVTEVDATLANKTAIAEIIVNGGSGQTVQDEMKNFDVIKFERVANPQAGVFARGASLPLKDAMRDGLRDFFKQSNDPPSDPLQGNRKAWEIASVAHNGHFEGQLLRTYQVLQGVVTYETTFDAPWNTQPFTWNVMLAELLATFGLQPIIEEGSV